MRKVFLFWGIIVFVLILGVVAFIYGKILLKEEEKKEGEIMKEITLPQVPEIRPKIEPLKRVLPLDVEVLKTLEGGGLPEVPKIKIRPLPLPPSSVTPEIPTSPNIPKYIDIESLKAPELPIIPGASQIPPIGE